MQEREKNTNKEKVVKPVLLALWQRANIFWARPTHLNPTPRNETRKSACINWLERARGKGHDIQRKWWQMQTTFAVCQKIGK